MRLLISSVVAFQACWRNRGRIRSRSFFSLSPNDEVSQEESSSYFEDDREEEERRDEEGGSIQKELEHIEKLEKILSEIKGFEEFDEKGIEKEDDDLLLWDENSLNDFLTSISSDDHKDEISRSTIPPMQSVGEIESYEEAAARGLEKALMQGVVPVSTTIGSEGIPGDFGFDPLGFADRDLFSPVQQFVLNLLPSSRWDTANDPTTTPTSGTIPRPKALVLRDYRECEIRHGRICMLVAMIWPLQEMLDRFILPPEEFGPLLFGPVTLPYFPLLMTSIMMLLGYLDIYSQAIKDMDKLGEAFLPGDCFWDPMRILDGATDRTKRIMQERELFNGRAAMIAVAAYFFEELFTHQPLIELENNALLLEPAYQVPFIQRWLDDLFARNDPLFDSLDVYNYDIDMQLLFLGDFLAT